MNAKPPKPPTKVLFVCNLGNTSTGAALAFRHFLEKQGKAHLFEVDSMGDSTLSQHHPFDETKLDSADHIFPIYSGALELVKSHKPPGVIHHYKDHDYYSTNQLDWSPKILRLIESAEGTKKRPSNGRS